MFVGNKKYSSTYSRIGVTIGSICRGDSKFQDLNHDRQSAGISLHFITAACGHWTFGLIGH